jgi:hypothetical protein
VSTCTQALPGLETTGHCIQIGSHARWGNIDEFATVKDEHRRTRQRIHTGAGATAGGGCRSPGRRGRCSCQQHGCYHAVQRAPVLACRITVSTSAGFATCRGKIASAVAAPDPSLPMAKWHGRRKISAGTVSRWLHARAFPERQIRSDRRREGHPFGPIRARREVAGAPRALFFGTGRVVAPQPLNAGRRTRSVTSTARGMDTCGRLV